MIRSCRGKCPGCPLYLFHCSLLSLSDLIWVGWEIYEVYRLHPSFISGCTLIAWVGGVSHSYVDRGSNFQNFQSCHPPSRIGHDQNNSTNPLYLRKYFCFCKHCVTFNSSFDTAFWLILSFISTKKHVTIVWFIIFVSYFSLLFYIPFHEELVLRGILTFKDPFNFLIQLTFTCQSTMWLSIALGSSKVFKSECLVLAQFWSQSDNCDWWTTVHIVETNIFVPYLPKMRHLLALLFIGSRYTWGPICGSQSL